MIRLTVFCLCVSLIWASPSPNTPRKVFPNSFTGRIVNGDSATLGQFPWQAALFFDNWFCGGSIISTEWILTAGQCVDGATYAIVITGSINVYEGDITDTFTLILHEGYDSELLANNIGLVKLDTHLTFNANTAAITLGSQAIAADTSITVSGYGRTSDSASTISETLNYVDLVTITKSECEDYYGIGSVRDEMICATSGTSEVKSTCSGDSGGPVISDGQQVAIVSFISTEGCESGAPSGYTRTATYRSWITENTGI